MSKFTKFAILLIFIKSTVLWASQGYRYPYENPDVAGLTTFLMKSLHTEPFKKLETIKSQIIEGRDKIKFFDKRSNLTVNFYPQKKDAPLVIMIADISGSPVSGYMMYSADHLQAAGYNVITVPSPFFWGFVVSSSSTGLPGLTSEDAADMYKALQITMANVIKNHPHLFTKQSMIGLGFGGLLAAHIADIDKREKKLNIDQYVLINPVVNIMDAVTEIETRTAIALELGMSQVNWIKSKALNFVIDNMDDKLKATDHDYFSNLENKFPLSKNEYKFLSGAVLRMNISDTIFSSQLVNDLGILKTKLSKYKVNSRHAEIEPYGLVGYIKSFFMPYFLKKHSALEILKRSNLNYVRNTLISNKNIFLIHNEDDFLINAEQLDYLKTIFGSDRRIIYPKGGHLGNLWYETNRIDLLNILKQKNN